MVGKIIATSPLTKKIYFGQANKTGNIFIGRKEDVTDMVLGAVAAKAEAHGGCFEVDYGDRKLTCTVSKISRVVLPSNEL